MEESKQKVILSAKDLHYTYQDGTKALQGVNLDIYQGERLAIMGSNGSGKSTFFLHLNGVLKPESGELTLDGKPYDYSRQGLLNLRKRVGIVFQDPDNQLFSANVMQEISFGILNLGVSEEVAKQKVYDVMEKLNITSFKDKPTHFLSGGQKKRVAIADILVMEPDIMILDEPTSALDPKHAKLIDQLVEELSDSGITVILSTHDVERALLWADKVVLFNEGKVLSIGKPSEIFADDELLAKTNLEKPAVVYIAEELQKEGILSEDAKFFRSPSEIVESIKKIAKK
ncbi:MAG: energy-coupling factor ABC transporter ATP-binding protein [Eubacteriales bacterium]